MPASQPSQGSLKITLVKSPIGYNQRQKDTVRALGLRKMNQTVVRPDNPQMRGMVFAVQHLVQVEALDEAPPAPRSRASKGKAE
jgi:large subunit ribosomal protein L30